MVSRFIKFMFLYVLRGGTAIISARPFVFFSLKSCVRHLRLLRDDSVMTLVTVRARIVRITAIT